MSKAKNIIQCLLGVSIIIMLNSCAKTLTKQKAFPQMYEKPPLSILVLPPLNESTAADATDYYTTTIAEPLALTGYYVLPIEVITDILKMEGMYDVNTLFSVPPDKFREYFGADAVLYIKILQWKKVYAVLAGSVTVSVDFQLVSTTTQEVLWQYNGTIKVDTSGDSGGGGGIAGLIAKAITTAVKTAATDYVPVARKANFQALVSIPCGKYHAQHGKDGEAKVVKEKKMEKANVKGSE